jgi:hypothetical protein
MQEIKLDQRWSEGLKEVTVTSVFGVRLEIRWNETNDVDEISEADFRKRFSFVARCLPGTLRDGVGARKLKLFLARRLHSSTRLAVPEVHGLVWVEQETLGRDPRTFQR